LPTAPACTRIASCKPPTVFSQRERASATSWASVAESETLPYRCWNAWSICPTSKAMFCACPRSCCVRWTFCWSCWSEECGRLARLRA